jgi:sortase A
MSDVTGGKAVFGSVPEENPAVNLVRAKLSSIYADEPNVIEEEKEIASTGPHSKHQRYMEELMASGKSLAETQTAWHEYYQSLPDNEKHEVWEEFYQQHSRVTQQDTTPKVQKDPEDPNPSRVDMPVAETRAKSMAELHKKLINTVTANGKLKAKHQIKSFVYSLAAASFVTGLLFFITNNERFIAPFIQPTKTIAAAPIITDGTSVGPESKIIIPKINLEAPIVPDVSGNTEDVFQQALEDGIVHYPGTPKPGEKGNSVVFGHSSANLFNPGKHKYVFVRLHQLSVGDTYAINYGGVQYVYKIISREVVKPTQVDVLYRQPEGKSAVSTLITCDPPGTSNNRLIIVGEQISPSPDANAAPAPAATEVEQAKEIPSNAPSLLSRLLGLN